MKNSPTQRCGAALGCPDLSIVIPAFNEAHRISASLEQIQQFLTDQSTWICPEIIIVCDGCTDDTANMVRTYSAILPCIKLITYSENRGKGFALKTGVENSQGTLVLISDADLSTPLEEASHLAQVLKQCEAHVVIGSRRIHNAKIKRPQPFYRRLLGASLSLFTRTVTGIPFKDTQCGFKLFSGTVARHLFADLQCDHFGYDLHILHKAISAGYHIEECAVEWHDRPGTRVRPIVDGIKILATAWSLRLRPSALARITSWVTQ